MNRIELGDLEIWNGYYEKVYGIQRHNEVPSSYFPDQV